MGDGDDYKQQMTASAWTHLAKLYSRRVNNTQMLLPSDVIPMTDEHKEIITSKFDQLAEILTVSDGLLNKLVAKKIITLEELDQLKADKKTGDLLRLLVKKEDRAFDVFVQICQQNTQPHVAALLDPNKKGKNYRPTVTVSHRN